ncbi:hypothetical protein [Methylomagnum sp.]
MQTHSRTVKRLSALALLATMLLSACASGPKPLTPLSPDDPDYKALEQDRVKFREKKVALLTEAMDLDDSEKDAFWSEYGLYEAELKKIYDDRYRLIRDYAEHYDDMTNEIADNLAERALKIREARNDLAKKYYQRLKKATSAITAARFIQVENEINLLSDLKVSSETPILPKGSLPTDKK